MTTKQEQAYAEGFVSKCAEVGVDPAVLAKQAGPLSSAITQHMLELARTGRSMPLRNAGEIANRRSGYATMLNAIRTRKPNAHDLTGVFGTKFEPGSKSILDLINRKYPRFAHHSDMVSANNAGMKFQDYMRWVHGKKWDPSMK